MLQESRQTPASGCICRTIVDRLLVDRGIDELVGFRRNLRDRVEIESEVRLSRKADFPAYKPAHMRLQANQSRRNL